MADKHLVISIFDDEPAAEHAAGAIKRSGVVVDAPIGVLVVDGHGKLKTHNVGATSAIKGTTAGIVLGALGPIGLGVGAIGGAVLGRLHHKSLGLDDEDRERIGSALRDGRVALAVLAEPDELVALESTLVDLGGETERHALDAAALREAEESGKVLPRDWPDPGA